MTTKRGATKGTKSTTKKKTPSKRGPKSVAEIVEQATDEELTSQMRRTSMAVYRQIEQLASSGRDIPTRLLGAARVCAEWHTDLMTVKQAAPDLFEDSGGGSGA